MYVAPSTFFPLALIWAFALYVAGSLLDAMPPWAVFAAVVLLSVPVMLTGLYLTTVRKINQLARFASQGWLYRLLSGRIIATVIWAGASLIGSLFILLQFRTYLALEWFAFLLVIPLLYLVYGGLFRVVRGELKPYGQVATALRGARRITPLVALLPYLLITGFAGEHPEVGSLAEAIALRRGELDPLSGSALVQELAHWVAFYDGARLFAGAQLSAEGAILAWLVLGVGGWVVFYGAACMLSCFLIPWREYRRVFASLSEADQPAPPEPLRVILVGAIGTLVVLFILLPAFAGLETVVRQQSPSVTTPRDTLQQVVVRIDGQSYQPEVLDDIRNLQLDALRELEAQRPLLEQSLDKAFHRMEANIDPFLDWYYQLTAEYLRTLNLLRGRIEDFVAGKLQDHLQRDDPFGEFEGLLALALEQHERLRDRFSQDTESALNRHAVKDTAGVDTVVIEELSLASLLAFPSPNETIPFPVRAGTGGAAGAITATVVAKVVTKLYAKGAIKLAAQPLTKAAVARGVAVAGGAAAGAAAGTAILPGIGTGAGALIGVGIGLATGIGVDYSLLKLEEHLSRETFREDLLQAVREVHEAYRAGLSA